MLKICAVNLISFQQYNKNQTKEFPQNKQTSRKTMKIEYFRFKDHNSN